MSQFIGTWLLIPQHTHQPDGTITPSRGENPAGILIYDQHGYMSVQLARTDSRAADYTNMNDLRTAHEGFLSYFGRYEVEEEIVKHHIIGSSSPHYRATTQTRRYQFSGASAGILTLRAANPVDGSTRVLVWQRVK
jgi:hypothetical protein